MSTENLMKTLEIYAGAWSETDDNKRKAILDQSWDDSGIYTDPYVQATGKEELSNYMRQFQTDMPGASFQYTSTVDEHHGQLRITWNMLDGDKNVVGIGTSFGLVGDDGRLQRMTGFFGEPGAES